MELAVILLMLAGFIIFFKLLGWIFKAGFYVLSIPFQIVGAILAVALVLMLVPFAIVAGLLTAVFAPLFVLGPFLPLLLVLLGVYLIVKK
ncbi:MAG: hypothetical protein ACE5HS_17680 [bacterium]